VALVFVLVAMSSMSCTLWRGRSDVSHAEAGDWEESAPKGVQSTEQYEARLRNLLDRAIKETEQQADADRTKVIFRRPYYFKEYDEFPQGAAQADIKFRKTESRTAPLVADVKLEKIRYATRMHRRRDAAEQDNNFLRDTGTETITYELRTGRWVRVGSLYVAEKTEEKVNGEWVPAAEEVQRTVPSEEQAADSWWRRAWDRITGQ